MAEKQQHTEKLDLDLFESKYDEHNYEDRRWCGIPPVCSLGYVKACFTFAANEVPYLFFPHLDTMESVAETETESDEEDYLAGLIQSMAESFLHDDSDSEDKNSSGGVESKDSGLAAQATITVSPQSTLYSYLSTSENSSPQLYSTPENPKEYKEPQQVKEQEINKPTASVHSNNIAKKPEINKQQWQTAQKPQPQPKSAWAVQNKGKIGGVRNCRALGLPSSAWPPLTKQPKQQKPQSQPQPKPMLSPEMRAPFLGSPGMKTESVGTGVFIPRIPNTIAEPRRKPACSMVLVPQRVALNLDLQQLGAQPRFTNDGAAGYVLDHEALLKGNASIASSRQKSNVPLGPQSPEMPSPYLHLLPEEWTY